ncbi:DUF202 domain-containing protein [Affinibrenneria salicis]|uniref:DUF202 domain-containing protein n=1 Tax=Affinibrenneria salicis TaxID=2590031 RepID=A0A5J5FUW6_9GAMM|nr:DUF202 domain-containing protein [Affinibrenneria salicis]KAA8997319.1 DUF202 domain-containing protein [Affinibrenneria salicis]
MKNNAVSAPTPGRQPERSGLAWSRTAFLLLLNSLLLLRAASRHHSGYLLAIGIMLMTGAFALYIWAAARLKFILHSHAPCTTRLVSVMRLLTLVICFTAMLIIVRQLGTLFQLLIPPSG